MNFLKKLFRLKSSPIHSCSDFWEWFLKNEQKFHQVIQSSTDGHYIDKHFFQKIQPQLDQLHEGIYYLTGMQDDDTAELILTPDGVIKNIAFIEKLIEEAPEIKGWKFTALKPATSIKNVGLEMSDVKFNKDNLNFYSNDQTQYPDEIDITIVHPDFSTANEDMITNGIYIFLDNLLGELNFATIIDNVTVIHPSQAEKELVPIEKLNSFLLWRQKEFIEKYDGTRRDTENDQYATFQGSTHDDDVLFAAINSELLEWDSKASHPWILQIDINYDGRHNNGLPSDAMLATLDEIEDDILKELKDAEGYLNVGRQTGVNIRKIWFACKEFRKPSNVLDTIVKAYSTTEMSYTIYKDKYWRTFNKFIQY